jgi:hypothetical protein
MVTQLLSPLGGRVPAVCSNGSNSPHDLNVCLFLSVLAVSTLFSAWFLGKCIGTVVFLEALDPAGHLSVQILEAGQPGQNVVVCAGGTVVCREIYGSVPVSSQWPVKQIIYI